MKIKLFLLPLILLTLVMLSSTCSKQEQDESNLSNKIGALVSVFELKPGDTKEIIDQEEKIVLSIKEIKDSVRIDCSLVDFKDNKKGPLDIRVYSYLQVNNQNIKVESKPCGALQYKNNGNDIQEVLDQINDLKSAPANSENDTYYTNAFINLFGEGSTIEDSRFKVYMAKAFPVNYSQPNANFSDYKFIFIVTRKK